MRRQISSKKGTKYQPLHTLECNSPGAVLNISATLRRLKNVKDVCVLQVAKRAVGGDVAASADVAAFAYALTEKSRQTA